MISAIMGALIGLLASRIIWRTALKCGRAEGHLEGYLDGWRDGRTRGVVATLWQSQSIRSAEMRARVYELSGDALAGRCIHGIPKDDNCRSCRLWGAQ